MATWYDHIDDERRRFIEAQHLFFVSTAPGNLQDGFPNISPKGRNLLRVLGPNLVGYLDYPGSGNETAAHLAENGRITLMFCSFEANTGVTRLYGRGRRFEVDAPEIVAHRDAFGADFHPYVRQAFLIEVVKVQTSCGYAVPRMDFREERDTLDRWCERKMEPRKMVDGLPVGGELVSKGPDPIGNRSA